MSDVESTAGDEATRARFRPGHGGSAKLSEMTLALGSENLPLRSGALHYWRQRPEHWRTSIIALRELGLSIVETYVPWGVHEVAPGEFDFGETDPRKNLAAFLDIVEDEGMVAFIRPGPHINAELTYFGLPEWISTNPAMQARSPRGNPVVLFFPPRMFAVPSHASHAYHEAVAAWFLRLGHVLSSRMFPRGPVALLQVDNEAGFFFRNGPFCQGYHEDAILLWHEFLGSRYGSLELAAKAFRTTTFPKAKNASEPGDLAESRVEVGVEANTDHVAPDEAAHQAVGSSREPTREEKVAPPTSFGEGRYGEEPEPGEFRRQLAWAEFQEYTLTYALGRMKKAMVAAGLKGVPLIHNVSLGEGGLPVNVPALDRAFDRVGFDYYHPASDHETIKRRTLYLTGTTGSAFAPELGVGAPPWFTPLSHADSLYCAMAASAFGLRGFNLYMAVDRDRWYGAAIDARGHARDEAVPWKRLVMALERTRFHALKRHAPVALVVPHEYKRLMRATHVFGTVSPSAFEAIGGAPTDGCRQDALGLGDVVQIRWWDAMERVAKALTGAGIPYVYVDSEASAKHWRGFELIFSPTFSFSSRKRWDALVRSDAHVVIGPCRPVRNDSFETDTFDGDLELLDVFDEHGLRTSLVHWMDEHDLERVYAAKPPIETEIHRDGDRDAVLFVMNPTDAPVETSIRLPAPVQARDLMSGEEFDGEAVLRLTMPPQHVRMLELDAPVSRRKDAPKARRRS